MGRKRGTVDFQPNQNRYLQNSNGHVKHDTMSNTLTWKIRIWNETNDRMTENIFSSNLQLETRILKGVPRGFCWHFRNFPFSSSFKSEMLRFDVMVHNTSVFVAYVLFAYPRSNVWGGRGGGSMLKYRCPIFPTKEEYGTKKILIEITRTRVMFKKFLANGMVARWLMYWST